MSAALIALVLTPGAWTPAVESDLHTIKSDLPGDYVAYLKTEIAAGRSRLLTLANERIEVGFVIVTERDDELLVQAAKSHHGSDLFADLVRLCEKHAREHGFHRVAFHTYRPGLVSKAHAAGYRVSEVIMRKELP